MNQNLSLHHFVVAPVVLLFVLITAGIVSPLVLVILSPVLGIFCARLGIQYPFVKICTQISTLQFPEKFPCHFPQNLTFYCYC